MCVYALCMVCVCVWCVCTVCVVYMCMVCVCGMCVVCVQACVPVLSPLYSTDIRRLQLSYSAMMQLIQEEPLFGTENHRLLEKGY